MTSNVRTSASTRQNFNECYVEITDLQARCTTIEATQIAGITALSTFGIDFYSNAKPTNAQTMLRIPAVIAYTIPVNLTGTQVSIGTPPFDGPISFSLKKNNVEFATIAITTGNAVTLTATSITSFAAGDILTIIAPVTADSVMADIAIAILVTRI